MNKFFAFVFVLYTSQSEMAHEMSQSPYPGRAMYPPYHDSGQQGDSMFSYQQHMRSLGYPFHMNSMSPSGYQHPVGQTFSMPHYEQSPSPPRDGKGLCS